MICEGDFNKKARQNSGGFSAMNKFISAYWPIPTRLNSFTVKPLLVFSNN